MTGDEKRVGMFLDSILQAVYELIIVVASRLQNNSPRPAVHEPVIGVVLGFVRPDGIGGVEADWHTELAGFVPELIEAGVVWVRANRGVRRRGWTGIVS